MHYTSANAYAGTQWRTPPQGTPLICDMSDDIFTRDIDVAAHGLIYADLGEVSLVLAERIVQINSSTGSSPPVHSGLPKCALRRV